MLKIENDSIVAKLYDIDLDELKHICESFKVLNKNNSAYTKTLITKYEE